jgi:hypothetical protein
MTLSRHEVRALLGAAEERLDVLAYAHVNSRVLANACRRLVTALGDER